MSYSYRLRDGNINPKEVLKNQINFKSDLGEIKKKNGNPKSKPENQISAIQNVEIFLIWEKKLLIFRDYFFLLSDAENINS